MKKLIVITLLLVSIFSKAQTNEPRSLKLGVHIGRSQSHVAEANTIDGNEGTTVPLFHTMLNQFGVGASLGSLRFPQFQYNLSIGYQSLETAYNDENNWIIDGYNMPVLYLKSGMAFSIPLNERWKIIPSVNAAFNLNLDKSLGFEEWSIHYTTERYFVTLNPALELQINTDGAWFLSLYAEYQYGFSPVISAYYPIPGEGESKLSTYEGIAMNFGLKLSYCLPCQE